MGVYGIIVTPHASGNRVPAPDLGRAFDVARVTLMRPRPGLWSSDRCELPVRRPLAADRQSGFQFFNRFAKRQNGHGAAAVIDEGLSPVDAQMPIDGGPQIIGRQWTLARFFAFGIR